MKPRPYAVAAVLMMAVALRRPLLSSRHYGYITPRAVPCDAVPTLAAPPAAAQTPGGPPPPQGGRAPDAAGAPAPNPTANNPTALAAELFKALDTNRDG